MLLASSGRPSATGHPPVVVDSIQILFGRHIGWYPDTTRRLGISCEGWRLGASKENVAVQLEAPFLSVFHLDKGVSGVGEWGARDRGKEGRQGGAVCLARLSRAWPARLRKEGDINS